MRNAVKADDSERAIKAAVYKLIDKSVIEDVTVTASDDQSGEPSLFVTVYLRDGRDRPHAKIAIELVTAMRHALYDVDDERFPYLSFSAPDDEEAEDMWPVD